MKLTWLPLLATVEGACGPRLNIVEKKEYTQKFNVGFYKDPLKWTTDSNAIIQKNMLLGQWRSIFTQIALINDSIHYDDGDVTATDLRPADCDQRPDDQVCRSINLEVTVKYSICRDLETANPLNTLLPYFL